MNPSINPLVKETFDKKVLSLLEQNNLVPKNLTHQDHLILIEMGGEEDVKRFNEILFTHQIYAAPENSVYLEVLYPDDNESVAAVEIKKLLVDKANAFIKSDIKISKAGGNILHGYEKLFEFMEKSSHCRAEFATAELAEMVASELRWAKQKFFALAKGKGVILYLTAEAQKQEQEIRNGQIKEIQALMRENGCAAVSKSKYDFQREPDKITFNLKGTRRLKKAVKLFQKYGHHYDHKEGKKSITLLSLYPKKPAARTTPAVKARRNGKISDAGQNGMSLFTAPRGKKEQEKWLKEMGKKQRNLLGEYGHKYTNQYMQNGKHHFSFKDPAAAKSAYELFEKRYGNRVKYVPGKKSFLIEYLSKDSSKGNETESFPANEKKPENVILELVEKIAEAHFASNPEKFAKILWDAIQNKKILLISSAEPIVIQTGKSKMQIDPADLKVLAKEDFLKLFQP